MFHQVAYFQATSTATNPTAIAAVADPTLRVQGNDIFVPAQMPYLLDAALLAATGLRLRMTSPSMLRYFKQETKPIFLAAIPSSPHINVLDPLNPIPLVANEALDAEVATTGGAAENDTVLAWLCDGPIQPVQGDIRTIRATGATTLVVNTWTNVALTLDQQLPAGRYACVGLRAKSTNLQAARMFFPGYSWRPGVVGVQAENHIANPLFRNGGLGTWGEFEHNVIPTIDCLANVADTAQVFDIDIIKIR